MVSIQNGRHRESRELQVKQAVGRKRDVLQPESHFTSFPGVPRSGAKFPRVKVGLQTDRPTAGSGEFLPKRRWIVCYRMVVYSLYYADEGTTKKRRYHDDNI